MLVATKDGSKFKSNGFDFGDGPVEFFLNTLVEDAMRGYSPSFGDPSHYVASVIDGNFGVEMISTSPVRDEIEISTRAYAMEAKSISVKPYTKKDGTKVSGHERSGSAATDSAVPPSKRNPGGVEFKPAEGKTDLDFAYEQYGKAVEKHGEAFVESVVREWDSDRRTAVRLQVASMLETALGNSDKLGFSGGLTKDALEDAKTALLDDAEAIGVVRKLGLPDAVELARDLPSAFDTDEFLRDNEEWNWLKPDDIDEARAVKVMLNALESGSLYDAIDKEADAFVSDYVKKFGDEEISQLDRKKMDAWNNAVYAIRGMEEIGIGDSALASSFDKAIADIIPSLDPISAETLADKARSIHFGAGSESQEALSKLLRKEIEAAIESLDIDHLEAEYKKAQELSSYAYEGRLAKAITAAKTKAYEKEALKNTGSTKQQQIENDENLKQQYRDVKPRIEELAAGQSNLPIEYDDLTSEQREAGELGYTSPDFILREARKEHGELGEQFDFRGHTYSTDALKRISSRNRQLAKEKLLFQLRKARVGDDGELTPFSIGIAGQSSLDLAEQAGLDMSIVRDHAEAVEKFIDKKIDSSELKKYEDRIEDEILWNQESIEYERVLEAVASSSYSNYRLEASEREKETGLVANSSAASGDLELELFENTDGNYKATQALAKSIQNSRTKDIIQEKIDQGLIEDIDVERAAKEIEDLAWSQWKSSSTTDVGKAMQLAAVEEFGALGKPEYSANRDAIIGKVGDLRYELIKAHLRATWETTQYLLERNGQERVTMWRGLMLDETKLPEPEVVNGQFRLNDLKLLRNGISSATTSAGVANGWGGIANNMPENARRVVLRIEAGPEDILTLPVFGDNVHDEQEVIPLGSRWNRWDAWLNRAPEDPDASWKQETIAKSVLVDLQDQNTIVLDHEGEPNWLSVYGEAQDAIDESYDDLVEAAEREADPELKSAILGISSILKTQVKPYTKKDGTKVSGYTREGNAAAEDTAPPTGSAAIQIESKKPGNQQTAAVSRTKYNQLAQELASINMKPSLDDSDKDRSSKIKSEMAELFDVIENYHASYTEFSSSAFRGESDNNRDYLKEVSRDIEDLAYDTLSEQEDLLSDNAREAALEDLSGYGDFPKEEEKRKKEAIKDILRLGEGVTGFTEEDAKRIFEEYGENASSVYSVGDMIYSLRDAFEEHGGDYDEMVSDIKELQKEHASAQGETRSVILDRDGKAVSTAPSGNLEDAVNELKSLPSLADLSDDDPDWREKSKEIKRAESRVQLLLVRDAHIASMDVAGKEYDSGYEKEDAIKDSIKSEISRLQEEHGTDVFIRESDINRAAMKAYGGSRPSTIDVSKEDMQAEINEQINEIKTQMADAEMLERIEEALNDGSSDLYQTMSSWEEMYEDPEETEDYYDLYEEKLQEAQAELASSTYVDVHGGAVDASDEVRSKVKESISEELNSELSAKVSREDQQYTAEKVFGSSWDLCAQTVNTWAESSSNSTHGSLVLQEAVRMRFGEMFGIESTVGDPETLARAQETLSDPVVAKTMQAVVDTIYENTQEKLKQQNYALFRGMSWGDDNVPESIKNTLDEGLFGDDHLQSVSQGSYQVKGKFVYTPVEQNPVSSFSTDYSTSRSFALVRSQYKAMLFAIVPKERIFSTFMTGPGCMTEAEFTVLGGDPAPSAMWIQKERRPIPTESELLKVAKQ